MISKEQIDSLPQTSGVYQFLDHKYPIYIGKSINIRARIKGHLTNSKFDKKEEKLFSFADDIIWQPTVSDFEAILLESELIRKHKPKYNVLSRDDKRELYILITKEKYPKILMSRLTIAKNGIYFGPFSSSRLVQELLFEIRRVVPFCTAKKIGKSACFHSRLLLCDPCPNVISHLPDALQKEENKYKKNRLRYDIISIIKPMVINYFYSENIIYLRNKIESELPNFYTKWVSQLKFELDNTLHRGIEISNRSFFIGPSDLVDMINDFYDDFNNQNYWRFNKRTGIHINIGRITNGYLSPIKGILFLEDSLVFKDMNNRSKSKFCKSLRSNICNDIKLKSLSLLQDNNINECESLLNDEIYKISSKEYKSFGINFNNKNYVEFRYIGGKVSKNILLDKVEYFINIFNLMSSPILKESLYHKKIYNFLQNRT